MNYNFTTINKGTNNLTNNLTNNIYKENFPINIG